MRRPSETEDPIDQRPNLVIALEAHIHGAQSPLALDEHAARTVHHDLGYRLVANELIERTEPEHRGEQALNEFLEHRGLKAAPRFLSVQKPTGGANLVARSLGILVHDERHAIQGHNGAHRCAQGLDAHPLPLGVMVALGLLDRLHSF